MPTYPGGKSGSGAAHRIITLMPVHDTYIEPFCGSAAVARLKKPAEFNYVFDLDPNALTLARSGVDGLRNLINGGSQLRMQGSWCTALADGLDFLEHHHFDGSELVYCDPPYMRSTRKSAKDLYAFEWTDEHHVRLIEWAYNTVAMVIISGYRSPLYDDSLAVGSRRFDGTRGIFYSEDFQAMTRRGRATETLWWNFERPTALHDDRYLGDGFRERERIRRRQKRWVSRLAKMPAAERSALIAAVQSTQNFGFSESFLKSGDTFTIDGNPPIVGRVP